MGKVKGQRTKGNTRPSNSLRSAQLLSSTLGGAPINTFIGFDALKDVNSSEILTNSAAGSSLLTKDDEDVDPDFKLTIKQMYKKDSITKIKALQKFADYCNEKEYEVVKTVLSMWPRVFNRLAIVNDFKVREATFLAQEALAKKLGKNIAPILKQIIAIWVISLHDTYPVAASAAKLSFSTSFSPAKQSEVLSFCKDEIVNYCKDIILVQTITSIDDPSNASHEDRESKYNRLVSCSLQSLCLLINSLTQPEIIEESITSFVQHDKFWKLEKYDDINVKVNWYRFKSVVCEKYPQIAIKNEAKFTSSTLLHIAEKDPLLSAAIWENVLWVLVTIDEWWKHININKGFLPHLRKMLREGSYGNASSIFPNLLPMLSKFPFKSIENPAKFCEDFIEAFEICILNPNHTGKEYACIVKSYFECLQYLLIEKNSLFTSESTEKLVATVCERVSTCTDNMLKDWHDIYGLFFSELTFFIASLKDPELITNLTSIVEIKLLKIIDDAVNDVQKLGLLTKLLSALLRINQDKSYRRVKFDEDESSESIVPEEKPKSKAIIFRNTLCKIWDRLLDLTSQKETQTPWLYCLKIVQELCILVSKESGCKFPVDNYLDNLKYLLKSQTNFTVPSTRSANYKHIINMLINSCDSSTKKNEILRYLSLCDDNLILINLFELMQSRIEKDDFLKDWFTTPEVAPLIVNSCNKILNYSDDDTQISISDIKANAEFIKFSFKINDIHHPTINEIASMLSQSLTNPTSDDQLLIVGSIIKALFDQYLYSSQLDSSVSLILKVTQSCLYMNTSGEALQLLKSILTSGLNKLIDNDEETNRDQLLYGIASILRQSIMIKENSFAMAERTSTIAALFMNTVQKKIVETESFNFLVNLLENILPEDTFWIQRISEIGYKAFFPFWINGQVIISKGLKFSTNHINHDQSLIYSIYSIITILESLVKSASITKKIVDVQLPFICFTLEYLESMPKSINFQERETILQSLSNYLKKIVGSMTRNEAIPFVKKLILSEPHPAIALILGLKPLLCYCKKLSPIDSEWKLETFNPESISVFQSINQYFDSDEIIQLAQDSLKYFLCMEDASSVRQSYGRLAVMNTILSGNVKIPTLDLIDPLMEHMIGLKEKNEDLLLLECSLDNRPEEDILFAIEVINIFQTIISKFHKDLSLGQKDLIIISVTAWSISLSNSDAKSYENPVKMVFFCRFFQLLLSIHHKMEAEGDNFASLREWTDFHLLRISSSLVPLLFKLNGLSFTGYQLDYVFLLGKCISSLPIVDVAGLENELNQFKFDEKPAHVEKAVIFSLPKEYESLFTQLNHLLVNKYPSFYLSSHNLIQKLIPMMVSSSNVIESSDDYLAPPKPFLSKLQETNVIVNTLLSEYSLGTTCCLINIGTDAFCYTTAYLLNWLQILNLFSQLNDENRSSLAGYLTESGYIFHLLDNLFKLMPVHPDDQISSDTNFIQDVLMKNNLEAQDESVHIQSLSCLVYFHLLRKMPACVRMWLSKLDKRISDLVNRFTTSTMSELICGEEFRAIQNADSDKFKNIKVKARHGAREVVAVYEIEDMSIELTIKLAENHPLTPVTIDGGKRVGVSVPEWRNWLLQVTSFLTHQNGTVLDGLILWNKNMCKRFEGLEECVICYFILHGSNCQVPKLTCRNCKKKFHSACLYKWFEKSNQSSCPLCRNPFTFSKQQFTPTTANPQQPYQRQHL